MKTLLSAVAVLAISVSAASAGPWDFYNQTMQLNDDLQRDNYACFKQKDQAACDRNAARERAMGATMNMQRGMNAQQGMSNSRQQQFNREYNDRQRASDRNNASGYYNWADQSRRQGAEDAAKRYQGYGDYYQRRSMEEE